MSSVIYIQYEKIHNTTKKHGCTKAAVQNDFPLTGQTQFQATQMVTPLKAMLTASRNLS